MIHLTPRQLRAASKAWEDGGCLALGLWASKAGLRDYGPTVYGEVVRAVREELMDDIDYSEGPKP